MNNLTINTKPNNKNQLFQNPVMKRFAKITEQSDQHVTYVGVAKKFGFFVLMIIAGIAITFLTNFLCGLTNTFTDEFPLPIIILAGISTLAFLITPFIAIFAKKTTAVTGSIFCVSVGVIYSALAIFVDEYRNEILFAMLITIALFSALTLLFALNIIKTSHKLKSTLYIILATLFIASIMLGILSFIPALNGAIIAIANSPVWCLALSFVSIALVSLFILTDLQNVKDAVNNNVPKSYEWYAAFGIIFSVIWLFAEIFQLITCNKNTI